MPMGIDLIVEPFQYKFMVRALIVCLAVGVMCPFLGAHVINRDMGFMGDALAHSVMPGLVAAYAVGLTPMFGAIPLGITVALVIGYVVKRSNVSNDTAMGILFAGLFALGLVLLSLLGGSGINVEDILLGQVMGTSDMDVYVTITVTVLTLLLMILLYKQMIFVGFDF